MWSKTPLLPVAAVLALGLSSVAFAQQEVVEKAFRGGNGLMEEGKYCDALARYKDGLALSPDDESFLYNAGLAAYGCKDFPESVKLWTRLKSLDEDEWQVRPKLIQAYQALGEIKERDAERAILLELWKKNVNEHLSKQIEFCRDQFEAGGEKVMAFEHFELKGPRALRYVFSILDETGKAEKYRISLGSYDLTNNIWRETTNPKPKDDERLFHLDGYYDWGHATYGMFNPEPSYDQVRMLVVEILEKKLEPVSSSRVPGK